LGVMDDTQLFWNKRDDPKKKFKKFGKYG
jgi:hypothetical protein